MKNFTCVGQSCVFLDRKDFKKLKFSGRWYCNFPLSSKRRLILFKVSRFFAKLKYFWLKATRQYKKIVPTFEIVTNPEVKLSEIKERRFKVI